MSAGDLAINCHNGDNIEGMLKLLIRNAVDCSEYTTCDNKDDSWKSILKRLIVEDADGNLALNVCGCECEGGGESTCIFTQQNYVTDGQTPCQAIDVLDITLAAIGGKVVLVTYDQLITLIGASGLTPGMLYLITDFATVHYFTDNGSTLADINTGVNEPLLVMATSVNTMSHEAFSLLFPQDVIHYDWDANNWLIDISFSIDQTTIVDGWKGVITYRWDTRQDNETMYDFRNVKFRRWALNPDDWAIDVTYGAGDYVLDGHKVYRSMAGANLGNATSDTDWWVELVDCTSTYYWSWQTGDCNGITVDDTDYDDFTTFDMTGYTDYIINNHIGGISDNYNFGNASYSRLNNIVIFGQPHANIFGMFCYNATIGNSFYSNTIGTYFYFNTIGNSFSSNTIGTYFNYNTIGTYFNFNTIGNYFYSNTIGNSFYSNTIGNSFSSNTIVDNFQRNMIYDYIQNLDFTLSTHVYATYNCTLVIDNSSAALLYYFDSVGPSMVIASATA